MRLIFAEKKDVADVEGPLCFGANGLQRLGGASGLSPLAFPCPVPRDDRSYLVYGSVHDPDLSFRILRFKTWDGIHYEGGQEVFRSPVQAPSGAWLGHLCIVHNGRDDRLLCLAWARGKVSHALWGYASEDGQIWKPLAETPLYHDHDSFFVLWHAQLASYVAYQTTYQTWGAKPYADNIGGEIRRVQAIRTSMDGLVWEPAGDVGYKAPHLPDETFVTPDDQDPVELEFYRLVVFPHHGRFVGMALNYAPSPGPANTRYPWTKHGPHLGGEWWLSDDGLSWRRLFRACFAPGEADGPISHVPMQLNQGLLWIMGDQVFGLPEDRIFFAGSMANSVFSTPPFTLTDKPLALDASFGFQGDDKRGMRGQGHIMAALLDENGSVIDGFDGAKCVIHDLQSDAVRKRQMDGNAIRLHWQGRMTKELAGVQVRLRIYLRDARIYALRTS